MALLSRVIEHARGHRRIELFQRGDGGWGYREQEKKDGRWRSSNGFEAGPFRTCAEGVAAAELTLGWVASALEESKRTATGYHLELLRGLGWRLEEYREEVHGEHSHCADCHRTLMDRNWPGEEHQGYVAKYEIPFGDGKWQWNWVCLQCFEALRTAMDWRVES